MKMNIKETFLKLTERTYPHGTEDGLDGLLPNILQVDEFGNKYVKIGESTCMFTSHLDTATSANTEVNHVIEGDIIKTDGTSILGADDKAGVTILLNMIENKIPGLYYFFLGEEVGCIGSKKVASVCEKEKGTINKVISFDRRGTTSVITYQASSRCCSDKFGEALAKELNKTEGFNYSTDPTGIYTDSAQFTSIYPECTNISVGYRSEHTFSEQQDIAHLEKLAEAVLKVDWENLPVERDPSKKEYRSYGSYYGWDEWDDYGWGSYGYPAKSGNATYAGSGGYTRSTYDETEKEYFMDPEYNYICSVKKKKYSSKVESLDFPLERISNEKNQIIGFLDSLEVDYEEVKWDGMKLIVKHTKEAGGHLTECSREEIAEFLTEFDFWKKELEDYKN